MTMAPARYKAKRLSSVNHTTKTIHHHHHHHHHHHNQGETPYCTYTSKQTFEKLDNL